MISAKEFLAKENKCVTLLGMSGVGKTHLAKLVGKEIAQRAKKSGISEVYFDRGGFLYHGRVKALADAAREGGLKF